MKKKINKNEKFYIVRVEASDFGQEMIEDILDMTIDAFNSQRKKNDASYIEMKYTEKK